jgi:hypothetical protein
MANRRACRIDANQRRLAALLAVSGWKVWLASADGGPIDLVCSDRFGSGVTFVLEIKDGSKAPSARRLTERCHKFLMGWPGPAAVAINEAEVMAASKAAREGKLTRGPEAAQRYVEATGGVGK